MRRCEWALATPLEQKYHDEEWGIPIHDDRLLFEFLILEGAQAGLSWSTILKKRDGYRKAFDNFDAEKIARYSKKRGFMFVGATICYAFMQAVGMVNDHTVDCFRYEKIKHWNEIGDSRKKRLKIQLH